MTLTWEKILEAFKSVARALTWSTPSLPPGHDDRQVESSPAYLQRVSFGEALGARRYSNPADGDGPDVLVPESLPDPDHKDLHRPRAGADDGREADDITPDSKA